MPAHRTLSTHGFSFAPRRFLASGIALVLLLSGCGALPLRPATAAVRPTRTSPPTQTASPTRTSPVPAGPTPDNTGDLPNLELPDGETLVFSGRYGIYTLAAAAGQPSAILEDAHNSHYDSPSWSPLGDRLIYSVNEPQGARIYTVHRDGSNIARLLNELTFGYPDWSPDGQHIAYTTNVGLFVSSPEGTNRQVIVKNPSLIFPAWSPDGTQLALLGNPGDLGNFGNFYGTNSIYLVDSDGKNLRPVSPAVAGTGHLAWSPDGTRIAFRSHDDCGDIDVLDLATGSVTDLTNTPGIVEQDPAWSPDGGFIAFSRAAYMPCEQDHVYAYQGARLYLMRADGHNLTPLNAKGDQPSWWPTLVMHAGWRYSVTHAAAVLAVRAAPRKLAPALVDLPPGGVITLLDGPLQADGAVWWHVRTDAGEQGWSEDVPGWYMLASTGAVNP